MQCPSKRAKLRSADNLVGLCRQLSADETISVLVGNTLEADALTPLEVTPNTWSDVRMRAQQHDRSAIGDPGSFWMLYYPNGVTACTHTGYLGCAASACLIGCVDNTPPPSNPVDCSLVFGALVVQSSAFTACVYCTRKQLRNACRLRVWREHP